MVLISSLWHSLQDACMGSFNLMRAPCMQQESPRSFSGLCSHEVLCQRVSAQCDVASRRLLLAAACAYASGCLVKQAGAVRAIEFGKNMHVMCAHEIESGTQNKKSNGVGTDGEGGVLTAKLGWRR